MKALKEFSRKLIWRLLGIDYYHALRATDCVFLKEDSFSVQGIHSYNNCAKIGYFGGMTKYFLLFMLQV